MKGVLKHPVRVIGRSLWLAGEILLVALDYVVRVLLWPGYAATEARTRWLQRGCRRVLRVLNTEIQLSGPVPVEGLLVSNHLSYLDILVLSAATPAVFVAKREVKGWPVFGWFASLAGTVFVDREKRTHVGRVTDQIDAYLQQGSLLVLFPEGTSSDGRTVLPFKSSLLEPATRQSHSLSASLIRYELDDGDVGEEVCYWKDMTFLPHLINLLGKAGVRAHVQFSQLREGSTNRKELARQLHTEVLKLKHALAA